MPLLADDDLGSAQGCTKLGLPLKVGGLILFARRCAFEVVLLPENEQHHVGVLLDGAALPEVRKLGPLAIALLNLARQLRKGEDRHLEFLRQGLEPHCDLGDVLDTALAPTAWLYELQVIDDEKANVVLALHAPRARH